MAGKYVLTSLGFFISETENVQALLVSLKGNLVGVEDEPVAVIGDESRSNATVLPWGMGRRGQ